MKNSKLIFIVLVFLFSACNHTENKKTLANDEKLVDTTEQKMAEKSDNENNLDAYKIDSIKQVIALFKAKDIDKISNKISFPLTRQYPIPPIKDKKEFQQRFDEVFDNNFIDKIVNSKMEQWTEVGWRGIMFDNGLLGMGNSDGVITYVNYQSDFEKNLVEKLINNDRETLYVTLRDFVKPTYKIKTKRYLIRIDELSNSKYRYASWKIGKQESSEPDLIIENGELEYEGSGGNHKISFVNENHIYKICRNIISEDVVASDITLIIEKDGQIILTEDGTIVEGE